MLDVLEMRTYPEGCLVPVSLAEELCAESTSNTGHGPPAVDELRLLEALEVGRGRAQAEGVEAE
jgi:hypothetical protein